MVEWTTRAASPGAAGSSDGFVAKRLPERIPVGPKSVALFRLGEQCNNACPMCSNSGRPEAFHPRTATLLERVDSLVDAGFRRVVLTGGEPTIHPGFWPVAEGLFEHGVAWDINTHGRSFSAPGFCDRAVALGLERAIVSLHSHVVAHSMVISGCSEQAHRETLLGIDALIEAGVSVWINCVLSRVNCDELHEFVTFCARRFSCRATVKVAFPTTSGKGGGWAPIQLRYSEVMAAVKRARAVAEQLGVSMAFEGFPCCVLGVEDHANFSRSGFGETHYLEDLEGRELYSIRHIEAQHSAYPLTCRPCPSFAHCPGVARAYLAEYGGEELLPLSPSDEGRDAEP